jgi:prevent-host-death family protein
MARINISKFKEQCLTILDHLDNEGIVVTKHGKPIAKVIPIRSSCADLIGSFQGKLRIKGDIVSTGLKWNAES